MSNPNASPTTAAAAPGDSSSASGDQPQPTKRVAATATVALTGSRTASNKEPRTSGGSSVSEPRSAPLILPPAKVDETLAAEAARIQREVAEARGDLPPRDDARLVPQPPPAAAPPVAEVEAEFPVASQLSPAEPQDDELPPPATGIRARFKRTPEPPVPSPAAMASDSERTDDHLEIRDVASLDDVAQEVAAAAAAAQEAAAEAAAIRAADEVAEARAAELRQRSEAPFEVAAESPMTSAIDAFFDEDDDDDLIAPSPPALGLADISRGDAGETAAAPRATEGVVALDQTVAEVAASVIARMRSIGEANDRHLEAVELEAARRCELLTAQAELDAELIRLHARREAHAIISAARLRAGDDPGAADTDKLSEIGETFSRFAESIETTIAPGPESPDTPRMP